MINWISQQFSSQPEEEDDDNTLSCLEPGQLFRTDPRAKIPRSLVFPDCRLEIRRSTVAFNYLLLVSPLEFGEDEDDDPTFLIDASLGVSGGDCILGWIDADGVSYEWIHDASLKTQLNDFQRVFNFLFI